MRPPALALISQGDPDDPGSISGVPHGLREGLRSLGAEVHAIPSEPWGPLATSAQRLGVALRLRPRDARDLRGAVDRAWHRARLARPMRAVQRRHLARHVRALPGLGGIVQYGTEFVAPGPAPVVTLEDMTVAQALRTYPWPHLRHATPRELARYDAAARAAYARATAACASTHWAADSLRDDYGLPAGRVHVVGHGRPPDPEVRERDWSVPRFLFVGYDWERKGGPRLVRAFARVRERHPEATLDVVSSETGVHEPGVTCHGTFSAGSVEGRARLDALWARATCFVMPSVLEPGGIVHLTAGAIGLPSIGTTEGGAVTMIGPGGRLVAPGDDEALLDAMLAFAEPQEARRVGELARAHSRQFTWEAVAGRLLRALAPAGVALDDLPDFL